MNVTQARYLVNQESKLYRADFSFESGKLVIISNESHLKCVCFGHRQPLLQALEGHYDTVFVPPLAMAMEYFNAYFSSRKNTMPPIDLDVYTDGEKKVYNTLMSIQPGQTISYGELARLSGFPGGARFIGNTMAKNMFPIIIPCHRVIKSDGSIGNYSSGTRLKEFLLYHEGAIQ